MISPTGWALRFLSPLGLALAAVALVTGVVSGRPDSAPASPAPTLLQADEQGLTLAWRAPRWDVALVDGEDGRIYTEIDHADWDRSTAAGKPQVPVASALVVVPPAGDLALDVTIQRRARLPLQAPLLPAPGWSLAEGGGGLEPTWARDESLYRSSGIYPADVVTLEEVGWVRGRRLARLTFHPLRVDLIGGALLAAEEVAVTLRFSGQPDGAATAWTADDRLTPVLERSVINPRQVATFARPARVRPMAAEGVLVGQAAPADTEYLIVSHADFITAVAPLAAHRAITDGLTVYTTTTQAIYDAYSGGAVSAMAIREYISATYHAPGGPVLDYVLLVGDGTADGSAGNYVPPYTITLKPGDPPWWENDWAPEIAACDNCFVQLEGEDKLPDVSIGRLPVNAASEAEAVVDKILAYEQSPPQWPWNARLLFFAGNEASAGDSFHAPSDQLATTLPVTYRARRTYFCDKDCDSSYKHQVITNAHDLTLAHLGGGGLIANYVGHSSWHQWAFDQSTGKPMFHLDDVVGLNNGGALPVFLQMTCYTSRFFHPEGDTLDEGLVRHPQGGAAATWGPSALGCSNAHDVLDHGFFEAVFDEHTAELGRAIESAQLDLSGWSGFSDYGQDLLDTFILLGDPAMDLSMTIVPWSDELFLPLVMRDG